MRERWVATAPIREAVMHQGEFDDGLCDNTAQTSSQTRLGRDQDHQ
jgi:hypothetical protein